VGGSCIIRFCELRRGAMGPLHHKQARGGTGRSTHPSTKQRTFGPPSPLQRDEGGTGHQHTPPHQAAQHQAAHFWDPFTTRGRGGHWAPAHPPAPSSAAPSSTPLGPPHHTRTRRALGAAHPPAPSSPAPSSAPWGALGPAAAPRSRPPLGAAAGAPAGGENVMKRGTSCASLRMHLPKKQPSQGSPA